MKGISHEEISRTLQQDIVLLKYIFFTEAKNLHVDLSVLIMFSIGNVPETQCFLILCDQRQREKKQ